LIIIIPLLAWPPVAMAELWTLIWLENVKQAVDLLSESFHFFRFAPPRLF
jgi:hypothetical protein